MSAVCHVRYLSRFLKISCLLFVTKFSKSDVTCPLFVTEPRVRCLSRPLFVTKISKNYVTCPLFVMIS